MSKYQDVMYNRFKRVESSLKNIFSKTEHYHLSIDQYIELRNKEVYDSNHDYERLNNYYRGKLEGIHEMLFDRLQSLTTHVYLCNVNPFSLDPCNQFATKGNDIPEVFGSYDNFRFLELRGNIESCSVYTDSFDPKNPEKFTRFS